MQIQDALAGYEKLLAKRGRKEKLDALERDDLKFLRPFVEGYHADYARLDYDGVRAYELWDAYLADQRTFSGTLLNSEIFKTIELVYETDTPLTRTEFLRVVRRVKRIDAIMRALYDKKDSTDKQPDGFENLGD